MCRTLVLAFLLGMLTYPQILSAQNLKNRIQPGKMYNAGDSIYTPRYGFSGLIPQGWVGVLPRETEVFLLNSTSGTFGEIFVFGREKIDLSQLAESWKSGVSVSETVTLKATDPTIEGDLLYSHAEAVGNYLPPKNYRAFAATRCGEACITVLAISEESNAEASSQAALKLLKTAVLSTPREIDPYEGFDWKEFLSGKLLIAFEGFTGGKQQTKVTLCEDGSFRAQISKKGMMKDTNPDYKGGMKGSWAVEGNNSQATLTLTFEKKGLAPFVANLKFVDEELYINEERHYASQTEKCD
ncbi:hypothetical protein J0A67_20055 [Algoriphagus aestuariicola]|uniref:DUF3471 domain-containing protein n=1 Tax=Algoriphagus aestuariicola TaxID=1852016 RepID=A0ABS3BWJ0_9BACT|nr:hypothetical protein [Algoriphagus aestuariicola]MBN7803179.1 hypothetical protein [Algoriphagus aestuariicola]